MINKRFKNKKKTVDTPLEAKKTVMENETSEVPGPGSSAVVDADSSNIPSTSAYTMPPHKWFFTFMCMNIPVIGWLYLLFKAFGKKENQLRDFAKAYLLYKLVFLVISLVLLGILIYIGLDIADKLLAYMEML